MSPTAQAYLNVIPSEIHCRWDVKAAAIELEQNDKIIELLTALLAEFRPKPAPPPIKKK